MPAKIVTIPDVGQVSLYKRRGVHGVKLSITHDGTVRITLPTWAPYRLGVEFARTKAEWIASKKQTKALLQSGDRVGKAHRLIFEHKLGLDKPASRLSGTDIKISFSPHLQPEDSKVQNAAEKAAVRALKKESEQLLPQRLRTLAVQHGFTYQSVSVKRLRSRWGSCNERKDIVLNCFLMQLPWHLIDYVLLHELVHTKVLRHGDPFWSELAKYVKDLKGLRKEMKLHQPALETVPALIREEAKQQQIEVVESI